ncbi:argininosuccinate lyase [Caballeronia turbans]|nr:argininosuccinate lyase [Caballeronia turbans]
MTKERNGVLLLSHCGFSFMEDLLESVKARGFRGIVLSSRPLPEVEATRLVELEQKADRLITTQSHALTAEDVEATLKTLQADGETLLCCICVWEGYRDLMALANQNLGVPDLTPAQVGMLRNKRELRNTLETLGLTRARAHRLTPETLDELKASGRKLFVKPVCGIASYGAFSLRPETTWEDLIKVADEASDDVIYQSAFGNRLEFLAEDYVPGREFSFEVILSNGDVSVLAVHEKCELTENATTVLENSCVCPPCSIDADAIAQGQRWINEIFKQLDCKWGCFHIEARFDTGRWDLIEINPRVGGSLISASVKSLNGQHSMLDLWLDLLVDASLGQSALNARRNKLKALAFDMDGTQRHAKSTFFRVYFAEPGRIEHVAVENHLPKPVVSQIFLKAGDDVQASSREVFLGQLLWHFDLAERETLLPVIVKNSNSAVTVRYAKERAR